MAYPFFVVATQNPIEEEGTYDLPAAQLDRFMLQVRVDYPSADTELGILDIVQRERQQGGHRVQVTQGLTKVSIDDLSGARQAVLNIHLSEPVKHYMVRLISATRAHDHDTSKKNGAFGDLTAHIAHPASPRATLALAQLAQARAWLAGRDHVVPDDVQSLASDVLGHRLNLTYRAQAEGIVTHQLINEFVERVAVV